ncbi:hypothetical protein ACQPZA_22950 [Pseudonocardia xinjiangensis]|uniref:hypothetical protein n=1 Tax=Pseudonocardia xinjiangensis TaxID=75289 RepID=UPI003D91A737
MPKRSAGSGHRAHDVYLISVIGVRGTPYACPDVSAVDNHIAWLYRRIDGAESASSIQDLWADIDLLLERRMFLQLDLQITDAA